MLTLIEKILFIIFAIFTFYLAVKAIKNLIAVISIGTGKPDWSGVKTRLLGIFLDTIFLKPTFKIRLIPSFFHALVAWGFLYYMLVNVGDVLQALIPNYVFLGNGTLGNLYRFGGDLLSVAVILGMIYLMIRRFVVKPQILKYRNPELLHTNAVKGIPKDSALVGGFILLHVGARFLGESINLAWHQHNDIWQPFASSVSSFWSSLDASILEVLTHVAFWLAIGLILAFIPYFPRSKHIHLIFTPLNFLLSPKRRSIGELAALDFEDESIEQFGASTLSDLSWNLIMDSYSCIMCYRCQQVCPAYNTGKILSPAALEINKRYYINENYSKLISEGKSEDLLIDYAISPEAVWGCTACGACVDICPVGNEPMQDILEIRRSLVLMDNAFPEELQIAFRGMERTTNPWNIPPTERTKWADGISVPTISENSNPDYLWWVGCAASFDPRAQKTAQAFARILNSAKVNYAILGTDETCTGDSARRSGNEYLFYELAIANVELFNELNITKIITTCPHCLHTIKNEYPAFDGNYEVIHHSVLIQELIASGKITADKSIEIESTTYHDPCYLSRHNGIISAPRETLQSAGVPLVEMDLTKTQSFCCGAGGGQMWKEEEHGDTPVSEARYQQALATNSDQVAVGCPFCLVMFSDAAKTDEKSLRIVDIAEIIDQKMV